MTVIDQKKNLRKEMLIKRRRLNRSIKMNYDQWICDSLWKTIMVNDFKTVHCYLPMGTEINIIPLIENMLNENITVITPKALPKRRLQNLVLTSLDELEKGVFGTRHPANAEEFSGIYELIIVPGLSFDRFKNRLGYGGGYYDNFLGHHPRTQKIGIFYSFQEIEKIPIESYDVKLDNILVHKNFSIY